MSVSVSNEEILKNIATSFIQLVTHYSNKSEEDELKFVVSTIADPKKIIQNKSKASDYFQFICCNSWDGYACQLFDVLSQALNINLTEDKQLIIEKANNSPRTLKNIFKKIIISNNTNKASIDKAIRLTLEEIVE